MVTPASVAAVFNRLLRTAQQRAPGLRVTLRVGRAAEFPKARDFAYCILKNRKIAIVVAPKLSRQSRARIEGLLAHEFGHAAFFHHGIPRHAEREADRAALALFGLVIRYDDADVQTTGHGRTPRPSYLPQ